MTLFVVVAVAVGRNSLLLELLLVFGYHTYVTHIYSRAHIQILTLNTYTYLVQGHVKVLCVIEITELPSSPHYSMYLYGTWHIHIHKITAV